MENKKDFQGVEWDYTSGLRVRQSNPWVKLVGYAGNQPNLIFSSGALRLILGNAQDGSVKVGLQGNDLYIQPCSPEDNGARYLSKPTNANKKGTKQFLAGWIGSKLKLITKEFYQGEVVVVSRDMFVVEMKKYPKRGKRNS